MCKWIDHPELYYPEPVTLKNCMKWHIAMQKLIREKERIVNRDCYTGDHIPCLADYKTSDEIDNLMKRDELFFTALGYLNVALIEAAILLGAEMYYEDHHDIGCEEPLPDIDIRDLQGWAKYFDIPLSEAAGGNLKEAYEYAFYKNVKYLQTYINRLGLST